jgi:hypothetical protein
VDDACGVQRGKRLSGFVQERCGTSRIEPPGGTMVDELGDGWPGGQDGYEPDRVVCGDEIRHRQHARQSERLNGGDVRGEPIRDGRIPHQRRIESQDAAQRT